MDIKFTQLEQKYKSIPNDIQEVLTSPEVATQIEKIGLKHGLDSFDQNELIDETGLVMLGLTHPNVYIGNIAERIGIPREKAKKIAEDINKEIFNSIKSSLQKVHAVEFVKTPPQPIKTTPVSIWEKMTERNKKEAASLTREFKIDELKNKKGELISSLTEVNKEITDGKIKDPGVLETSRAEAYAIQNKINQLDGKLRELRALMSDEK